MTADILSGGPPLYDTLSKIPCLLDRFLEGTPRAEGIRLMRLVSKELGCFAMAAVRSCTVRLGCMSWRARDPEPKQLVRLMGRSALRQLDVIFITMAGVNVPAIPAQLSLRMEQMECLLAGMGDSIATVTTLELYIFHRQGKYLQRSADPSQKVLSCIQQEQQQQMKQEVQQIQEKLATMSSMLADTPSSSSDVSTVSDEAQPSPENLLKLERELQRLQLQELKLHNSSSESHSLLATPCSSTGEYLAFSEDESDDDEPSEYLCSWGCTDGMESVLGGVFGKLASAVPHLTELIVSGSCCDAALHTFGALCPKLTSLDLDIPRVTMQAVAGLGQALPSLTLLALRCSSVDSSSEQQFGAYMDAFMLELQNCTRLTSLTITGTDSVKLACKPKSWELLPASLDSLQCDFSIDQSQPFNQLIRRVRVLGLACCPCDLFQLIKEFPHLQAFSMLGASHMKVMCETADLSHSCAVLKKRLPILAPHLDIHSLYFVGTRLQIFNTLSCIPKLPQIQQIVISVTGGTQPNCLTLLPHRFPHVKYAALLGSEQGEAAAIVTDTYFFKHLEALSNLETLLLMDRSYNLTTYGLSQLCRNLKQLTCLEYRACKSVNIHHLCQSVRRLGRKIELKPVEIPANE